MARDMQELAAELGRRDAADLQAHVARRRRWRMLPETFGTVLARVEDGRLLVDCPFCAGAELVARDVPFFCMSCGMVANAGHRMTVVCPDGGE